LDTVNAALTLPKWNYSYSVNQMAPELAQLGMGIAFGSGADLIVEKQTGTILFIGVVNDPSQS
jgi:hypothetical protein